MGSGTWLKAHHRLAWRTRKPKRVGYRPSRLLDVDTLNETSDRFDNSGQKKSFPGWHSSASNIRRTNEVIKKIANLYKDNSAVVPIIAALNE